MTKQLGFCQDSKQNGTIRKAKGRDDTFFLRALLRFLVPANGNGLENREGRQGCTLGSCGDVPKTDTPILSEGIA